MNAQARKIWALASLAPLLMLIAALIFKPYWRDELWSLYFSEPRLPLPELLAGRMREEVHPPLYYIALHFWRAIMDTDLWARALALPFLAAGAAGAWILYRGRPALLPFLLLSIGSYWVIYYAAETRSYTLLFVLCALQTLTAARTLESARPALWAPLFALLGALAGLTHYFGALYSAALGLGLGVALLGRKKPGAFFVMGAASVLALLPTLYWIGHSLPILREAQGIAETYRGGGAELAYGANQLLRGLVVKGFFSNPIAWAMAFLGMGAVFARKEALDRVLLFAVGLTIALAFTAHLTFHPMIKERAFVVIMPALFLIGARALCALRPDQRRAQGLARFALPIATVLMPLAFVSEYFKNREQLDQAAAVLQEAAGPACASAPVFAYLRGDRHQAFPRSVSERQLRVLAPAAPPRVIDVEDRAAVATAGPSQCPIIGVAFLLPRNEGGAHEDARRLIAAAAGQPVRELRFGGVRQLIFLRQTRP